MTFDPLKFSTIVQDNHFGLIESSVTPKVYVDDFSEAACCLRMDSVSSFKRGSHLVVEITHRLGNVSMKNIDESYTLYHQIKTTLAFLNSVLNKIELNEETMYARGVLSYVIGYEEKMLMRLKDNMSEMKRAKNGV